ncbi:MAG: ferritin-like domain-containing protein [Sphingomonas sp.]|uniref:ferritin-like domain-containing protein n=1 Tax=Sphingomonas sp. TaxID=28214 RepID=UPI0017A09903|nr:ferritin-like domain-containing protein [Sphingomonas sp.]MBA3666526.1 ferritin-like domain-containing protein [Sphingomonas sp.]
MDYISLDPTRRQALRMMSAGLMGAGLAGCADLIPQNLGLALLPNPLTDPAVYNFALNLEYLEAEFYRRGVYGEGLPGELIGPNPGAVIGGRRVQFRTPWIAEMFAEITEDETNHVRFIRQTISSSPLVEINRPVIDLQTSFRTLGMQAGLGPNFDPFADEESYILGAFIFEDVGVTAYAGGSDLIADDDSIEAAAGILAIEAYHAGAIRATIAEMGPRMVAAADGISRARGAAEGPNNRRPNRSSVHTVPGPKEQAISAGEVFQGEVVIAPTDPQGRSFPRPPQDVLNIVFMNPDPEANRGGFFPNGVQGVVRHAMYPAQTRSA